MSVTEDDRYRHQAHDEYEGKEEEGEYEDGDDQQYHQQGYEERGMGIDGEEQIDLNQELLASQEIFAQLSALLAEMPSHLNAAADLEIIGEADKMLDQEADNREAVLKSYDEDLKKLSATYAEARSKSSRPSSHPTPQEHERQMLHLEDEQLTTAKQVNEETSLVGKKEAELQRLRDELKDVEGWDVEKEGMSGLDGKVVRLQMMKELGFSLVPSRSENAGPDSLLIRNDAKNDIHSIAIDQSKNKFYNTNLFWNLASE